MGAVSVGQRFGRLEALAPTVVTLKSGMRQTMWLAACDCGQVLIGITSFNLRRQRSCGCLQASRHGEARMSLLRSAKRNSRLRGHTFELTDDFCYNLMMRPCHYCGKLGTAKRPNGMDRVDSTRGYSTSNVVACCAQCNTAKLDYTVDEFVAHARRVAAWVR